MNKQIKKILCFLMVAALMIVNVKMNVEAAGGLSISANASQVSSGGTFTVTVKAESNYFVSNITLSVSGGTVVSGLGKTSLDKGESTTAKIKLTGETCVVSVSGVGANYDTETEGTASASVTVKKKASTNSNNNNNNNSNNNNTVTNTKSKDNTLSAITVSEGSLAPAFNANTTEYTVAVSGTTEKITLGAKANHAKASVSGTGEKSLIPGHNLFTVTCTAENGSKKEYKVDVYVDETPLVFTTYNEQKLGVVRNQTNIGIPASFEETTVSLEGQEVKAYHSNQLDMSLVYLVSESGDKNFYIYEEDKGITSKFRPVSILGRNVIVYDLTEEEQIRDNMVYSEVTIDGVTLYGWTYENPDFANYIHILVMNEFGEKVVYQYEKTENSLQLYKEYVELEKVEDVKAPIEKTWFPNEYYMYAIVGLGALSLILLITLIYFIASRKARHEGRKRKAIKRQEKQRAKEEKQREKEQRELEKQRQIEEKEMAKQQAKEEKQRAKEEKKLARQKKKEK